MTATLYTAGDPAYDPLEPQNIPGELQLMKITGEAWALGDPRHGFRLISAGESVTDWRRRARARQQDIVLSTGHPS